MKHTRLILVSVILLSVIVGGIYLYVYKTSEDGGASSDSAKPLREIPAQALNSPQDQFITLKERRIALEPKDAEAHRQLAHGLLERAKITFVVADLDRAWVHLDESEALEPNSLRTLTGRANILLARHRFSQARALAEGGLQKFKDEPELLGLAGDGAVEMGDYAEAETHYLRRAEVAPDLPSTWIKLARLSEMQLDFDKANELMRKALMKAEAKRAGAESTSWIHARIGEIEIKRGNLDEARSHLMIALSEKPLHPLALDFLANLDQWQGNPKAAEESYHKLLSVSPNPRIRLRLASLLNGRGERKEAARLRDESRRFLVRAVADGHEGFLRDLATLELEDKHYESAAQFAARDMAIRPTAESRALLIGIIQTAAAAGTQIGEKQSVSARAS